MKKLLLVSLCFLVLCVTQVFAQDRTVTGTVTASDDGLPVPGVTVKIKGSDQGVSTDASGKYSISASSSSTLVFSFIAYQTQEIVVGNKGVINVTLSQDQKLLNEVLVVGYGTKTVREINGSIGSVAGEKLSQQPNESFLKSMSGKIAGVQVSPAGGTLADGVKINIRGTNSISTSNAPLYVIDGVPFNYADNLSVFNSGNGTRFDPFSLINPNDIESVNVLKDAGAGAIYGSRAANGVVLITTKKGKAGATTIEFNSNTSWASASKKPKLLSGDDFITISNEKVNNRWPGINGNVAGESDIDGDGQNDRTDWMKMIFRTGLQTDNSIAVSGGNDKAKYRGSVRYADQQGILFGNNLKNAAVRLNLEVTPNKYVHGGVNLSYTRSKNDGVLTDGYLAGLAISGYNAFPTVSAFNPAGIPAQGGYNITGKTTDKEGFGYLGLGNNKIAVATVAGGPASTSLIQNRISNPLATAVLNRNQQTPEDVIANTFLDIKPLAGLTLTTRFGFQIQKNFEDQYSNPVNSGLGASYNGLVQDNFLTREQWDWQNYLTYDRSFGLHRVTFTGGMEYQFNKRREVYSSAMNFADPFYTNILDGTYSGTSPGSSNIELLSGGVLNSSGIESYFARLGYVFNDRYSIEGAFRTDAFSGFGNNYRWGNFPSVSVGWIVSEEDFLKDNKIINYLKVHGSFGKTGNSTGVSAYASRTLYGGGLYAALNGFTNTQTGNADLRWESQNKTDIGFNLAILNSRISIDAEYFNNSINGLILNAPVLYTVGIPGSTITTNIGSMRNRGFEVTINTNNIRQKDFSWTTSFNFTSVKNKVLDLVALTGNGDITSASTVASVGRPVGTYRLYNWAGVDQATGYPMWYAADGTTIKVWDQVQQKYTLRGGGATTALGASDQMYQEGKTGTPTYYGGVENTLTYKNIDLNFNFVYSGGNYLYNSTYSGMLTNYFQNNDARIMGRWTTPGQVTDIPRVYSTDNTANQASTRFLEKGDFIRLRTIALGYNFDNQMIKNWGLSKLRLVAQVYNAFVITKYTGVDPEINTNRNNTNIATGYDNRGIPQPRTITLGLNASF